MYLVARLRTDVEAVPFLAAVSALFSPSSICLCVLRTSKGLVATAATKPAAAPEVKEIRKFDSFLPSHLICQPLRASRRPQ